MSYKINFLKKVILKIDFDKVELGRLEAFLKKNKKTFPIEEEKKGAEGLINFNLKTKEIQQESSSITVWNIYNQSKTVKIQIHPKFLALEYFKYKDFSELLSNVKLIDDFLKTFEIKTINRLGLRYVNEIQIKNKKKQLEWNPYINGDFLGPINFSMKNSKLLARAMSLIVFKENFGNINFNYGLWNSAYPNAILEEIFILDFDAYSKFPLSTEDIKLSDIVTEHYKSIKMLFENAITDKLRKLLNNE